MKRKYYGILLLSTIAVCAAVLTVPKALAQDELPTDWGVSYQEGKPVGNADAEFLKRYDAYFTGSGDEKTLYLTFNAGYENGYTESILQTLKKHGAPAAFFLVGTVLESSPETVRAIANSGNLVGCHSMRHEDVSRQTDFEAFRRSSDEFGALYEQLTGEPPARIYRPPAMQLYRHNLEFAQRYGYSTFFYSIAYKDWDDAAQPDKAQALELLTKRAHNGGIILLHSTSQTSAEILDELLMRYERMGYSFGRLDKLCK